jgi:hypothetical protein
LVQSWAGAQRCWLFLVPVLLSDSCISILYETRVGFVRRLCWKRWNLLYNKRWNLDGIFFRLFCPTNSAPDYSISKKQTACRYFMIILAGGNEFDTLIQNKCRNASTYNSLSCKFCRNKTVGPFSMLN